MRKVLIVDDQPAIRMLIYEVLSGEFEVEFASTGQDALRMCKEIMPDIILLDVGLPDMSGIDVLPRLKEIHSNCNIIILTGNGDNILFDRAQSLGAWNCISKPFDVFYMKEMLKSI